MLLIHKRVAERSNCEGDSFLDMSPATSKISDTTMDAVTTPSPA